MSLLIVPTFTDPSWTQTTTFEGTVYNLYFSYNQRGACWYLSIADANGVDIYNGIKLVTGFDLLRKCKDPRKPPGALVLLSSSADLSPPGPLELAPSTGRCRLMYLTSDWVAMINSGQVLTLLTQIAAGGAQTSTLSKYGLQ